MPVIYWLRGEYGEDYVLAAEGVDLSFTDWQASMEVVDCRYFNLSTRLWPGVQILEETTFMSDGKSTIMRKVGLWAEKPIDEKTALSLAKEVFWDMKIVGVVNAR